MQAPLIITLLAALLLPINTLAAVPSYAAEYVGPGIYALSTRLAQ